VTVERSVPVASGVYVAETVTVTPTTSRGVPEAARQDEESFRELVEEHRADLHAHCYRMLGSLHDADDALQDALLRAWRALPRFRGESSLRTWLHRIATNVCLDLIAKRPRRVLPVDYAPPHPVGEPDSERALRRETWIEPYPDGEIGIEDGAESPEARYERREALELAFVAALQHLPPRQRATLIMRDVLGYSAKETAASLETTVPSVNGALRRARVAVEERLPDRSQQLALRELGDRRIGQLAARFADAFERGEVDEILAMLDERATFSMPPYAEWSQGREAIAESWLMPGGAPPRLRYVETRANGQLALGTYCIDPDQGGAYVPIALDVLALDGERIVDVIAFREPEIFPRFGIPSRLPPNSPR
jgi:RNA polymerase sigma-70 factor, ECF subfamily